MNDASIIAILDEMLLKALAAKAKQKVHGCKVYRLSRNLTKEDAYTQICSRIRKIFFNGWSYDPRTGKARAFG